MISMKKVMLSNIRFINKILMDLDISLGETRIIFDELNTMG